MLAAYPAVWNAKRGKSERFFYCSEERRCVWSRVEVTSPTCLLLVGRVIGH